MLAVTAKNQQRMLGRPKGAPGGVSVSAHLCTHMSEGSALRLLLRVPLLSHRMSSYVFQGTQAECRPELYVDGGDIKVDKIWKLAEREVAEKGLWIRC